MLSAAIILALLAVNSATVSFAAVIPTGPGPNDVFEAGSFCSTSWTPDTTGTWTNMTITLMSGSNDHMTWVSDVAQGLDGTNPGLVPFNWTCPDVNPYGPIYFYQFTEPGTQDVQWTSRFTIASSHGEKEVAPNLFQPNGAAIPWGTGTLRDSGNSAYPASSGTWNPPSQSNLSSSPITPANSDAADSWPHDAGSDDGQKASSSSSTDRPHSQSGNIDSGAREASSGTLDMHGLHNSTFPHSKRPHPSRLSSSLASAPTLALPTEYEELDSNFESRGQRPSFEGTPLKVTMAFAVLSMIMYVS